MHIRDAAVPTFLLDTFTLNAKHEQRSDQLLETDTMPSNPIEWAIFIGAGIALGAAFFMGLST
jgi:hypothetical protein